MSNYSNRDNLIIQGCLENNRTSQKQLYMLYKDAMYTIVYRMLANTEEAEDALQEGFVNVFRNLDAFRGESSLGSWMKTIFVRTALKKLKGFSNISVSEEQITDTVSFDDALSGELIEKAILSLDTGYRTVFLLIEVEGYKHREVAEMLNISEGTSKSQLSRAKKILQERLRVLKY